MMGKKSLKFALGCTIWVVGILGYPSSSVGEDLTAGLKFDTTIGVSAFTGELVAGETVSVLSFRKVVDVRAGLRAAREAGIEIVVLTSYGAAGTRPPELRAFLEETERQGLLLAEFQPVPGVSTGPVLRLYRIAG